MPRICAWRTNHDRDRCFYEIIQQALEFIAGWGFHVVNHAYFGNHYAIIDKEYIYFMPLLFGHFCQMYASGSPNRILHSPTQNKKKFSHMSASVLIKDYYIRSKKAMVACVIVRDKRGENIFI